MHSNAALWSNVMKQKLKIVNNPRKLQFIDQWSGFKILLQKRSETNFRIEGWTKLDRDKQCGIISFDVQPPKLKTVSDEFHFRWLSLKRSDDGIPISQMLFFYQLN